MPEGNKGGPSQAPAPSRWEGNKLRGKTPALHTTIELTSYLGAQALSGFLLRSNLSLRALLVWLRLNGYKCSGRNRRFV